MKKLNKKLEILKIRNNLAVLVFLQSNSKMFPHKGASFQGFKIRISMMFVFIDTTISFWPFIK